jgi:predicted cupin superfamily sugar epimerase
MAMDADIAQLIDHFQMTSLPVEGTFFVSTWRGPDGEDELPIGTAMIGLYTNDPPSRSLFHRLYHDEVWHFYGGDPIHLVLLHRDRSTTDITLGPDVLKGHHVQYVVPAGTWQAGELISGGRWALFGCTMSPGFTSMCFEGGRTSDLLPRYPSRSDDIRRLGLSDDHEIWMPHDFAQ